MVILQLFNQFPRNPGGRAHAEIEFIAKGIDILPAIPEEQFSFESRLIGVKEDKRKICWLICATAGRNLDDSAEGAGFLDTTTLRVNKRKHSESAVRMSKDGRMEFSGESRKGVPLTWEIKRNGSR